MEIKERVMLFINDLGLPFTRFCQNVAISPTAFNRWRKDDLQLSEDTLKRIENYIRKFGY